jgi:hypothetical protein
VEGEVDIQTVFEADESATERFFDTFYALPCRSLSPTALPLED